MIRLRWTLLFVAVFLVGCGDAHGPQPFDVRGTVMFDGRPVPHGLIYFDPDAARGNDGVQGSATIDDGSYDTCQTGKGIGGGAYKVRIIGFETGGAPGKPPRRLFAQYTLAVEFPHETTMHDFEIPVSAAENLPDISTWAP